MNARDFACGEEVIVTPRDDLLFFCTLCGHVARPPAALVGQELVGIVGVTQDYTQCAYCGHSVETPRDHVFVTLYARFEGVGNAGAAPVSWLRKISAGVG